MKSTLQIENLSIIKKNSDINSNDKEVVIVKGLSATFESGKLNAIMGPNGSGKTSALSSIFGLSDTTTRTSGKILLDGKQRTPKKWYSEASIVEQLSYFPENETVEQALNFSLGLKNIRCQTNERISDHSNILDNLNLTKLLGHKILTLSGGEKQRIMIAIEIIADKKILILDEPTSDLDAHLALKLICFLKKLAVERSKMIILTIHQPSEQIVNQFDNILLMVNKCVAYSGPANQLDSFLKSKGIVKPLDWTTSDFLFEAFYNNSSFEIINNQKENISKFLNEISENAENIFKSTPKSNKSSMHFVFTPGLRQIDIILNRFVRQTFSNRRIYIKTSILVGILLAILFFIGKKIFESEDCDDFIKKADEAIDKYKSKLSYGIALDDKAKKDIYSNIEAIKHLKKLDIIISNYNGFIAILGCSGLSPFASSDLFENIALNEKEMLLGHYSPISFIIAAIFNEFITYCFSGIILCVALYLSGTVRFLYNITYFRIFISHVFSSFTMVFINSVMFLIPISETVRVNIRSLVTTLSFSFYFMFSDLLTLIKESQFLPILPFKILFGFVDFILPGILIAKYIYDNSVTDLLSNYDSLINSITDDDCKHKIVSFKEIVVNFAKDASFSYVPDIFPNSIGILSIFIASAIILPIITMLAFGLKFSQRVCLNP